VSAPLAQPHSPRLDDSARRAREQREAEEAARPATSGPVVTVVTFDAHIKIYVERVSQASGKTTWKADKWLLGKVADHLAADGRRLGDMPIVAITGDELEAFYKSLVTASRAASTRNHYVHLIKAAFRWAARKAYITRSPISDDSALVRSKHAQRARRITPNEEAALLRAAHELTRGAGVRVCGLIVAAIETGCRSGELLGWQWADVDLDRREVRVRGENTKDEETRRLPISTRLAAVLEMAQTVDRRLRVRSPRRARQAHQEGLGDLCTSRPRARAPLGPKREALSGIPCCLTGHRPTVPGPAP
jgi:integrase